MVRKHFWLKQSTWLKALTDQAYVIVSTDWRTPEIILLVLQANEWLVLLSNRRKEHQRPKAWAKAPHNSALVEGNIDNWFHYLLNHLFHFGCLTVKRCMDKYTKKIITASRHHITPIQGGTIRRKGYNHCHNVEDMSDLIPIAFDFWYPFLQ